MRLQKFLSRAGAASRRGSENLMSAGRVTVNGQVVSELGSKVDPRVDEVAVDGVIVHITDSAVVIMLNKPSGVTTTMSDPHARACVADLVPIKRYPGLFPIGRLDRDTTGLLLFSTDGELGNALLHPSHHVEKRYLVFTEKEPSEHALSRLRQGVELEDGVTSPARVEAPVKTSAEALAKLPSQESVKASVPMSSQTTDHPGWVTAISIHEGRKRQVRRMFDALGFPAVHLHRASFGPLVLGDLDEGHWRILDDVELDALYTAASVEPNRGR